MKHIRKAYDLRSHPQRLADLGLVSLREMARGLNLHTNTVKKWRDAGLLTGRIANDKGEFFYYPPGPHLTRPRIGRPPRQRPAPQETPTASAQGGAV
ncbi:hypothetical protein AB0G85_33720 [Streptomyces sioyaensis]|uniref:hypothetical protein n=1 Tax=Streptomyces sioyaensis TaxID=67364 RepID=UPI0033D9E74B